MAPVSNQAIRSDDRPLRLSAADVRNVTFTKASRRRRGYDEREVDVFLHHVEIEISRLAAERDELQEDSARLRQKLKEAEGSGGAGRMKESQEQAVRLLAKAQQTADQYVAEAEEYSRTLAHDARQHYEDILADARSRASATIEQDPKKDRAALEQEVAYLQTFGKACRAQLRSFLEALIREVEQEWGRADPAAAVQEMNRSQAEKDVMGARFERQPALLGDDGQTRWRSASPPGS